MRKNALRFAKETYFNGQSDARSIQKNFILITSFIHDSAEKHIPAKSSISVSLIPWINPEIRRKICKRYKIHAMAKRTGGKLLKILKTLRREMQYDWYVKNLVGDIKVNPRDFYIYINNQKKTSKVFGPLKKERKWSCRIRLWKGRGTN